MSAFYSAGEVSFLRRLDHDAAIDMTTRWLDSCAGLSADGHHSPGAGGDDSSDVPLIARWTEVQAAFSRVAVARCRELQLLDARIDGATERELATAAGVSQSTVHRHVRDTLSEVLVLLNGVVRPSRS